MDSRKQPSTQYRMPPELQELHRPRPHQRPQPGAVPGPGGTTGSAVPPPASEDPVVRALASEFSSEVKQADYRKSPHMWAKDKLGVHLWSKQRDITDSVRDNKRTVVASCHGSGKALALHTPLRTPDGEYILMRDAEPGTVLCDENLYPTTVTAVTDVEVRSCAVVHVARTHPGPNSHLRPHPEPVIASMEHEWPVLSTQEQARIRVLCERHGLKTSPGYQPDWSYWMHRTANAETGLLRMTAMRQIIPGARDLPTVRAVGSQTRTEDNAYVHDMFTECGTVDTSGRLCLRMSVPRLRDTYPPELLKVRQHLVLSGHQTIMRRERVNQSTVFTLSITSDPTVLLHRYVPASTHGGLSPADIEALVLSAWDIRTSTPPVGGFGIADIEKNYPMPVKCVQVDSPNHLYLAGHDDIPTHNSMIASVLAAWWVDVHPPGTAIVVSTAPTYAQVHAILWEEIRKHHATAKINGTALPGSISMADNWTLASGQIVGFGRKPKDGDTHAFQGIHRRYVLAILDEACGVPTELWTGAEAITTNDGCRILAIGNPDDRETDFGKNFCDPATEQDWNRISIPASSTPNLTGEKVPPLLNDVLVSKAWTEERLRAWGPDDPRYISKVMAQFPEQSQASLFSPLVLATGFDQDAYASAVPDKTAPSHIPQLVTLYFGVDVARFGGDRNVVVVYDGLRARVMDSWTGMDTVSSARKVMDLCQDEVAARKASYADIRVDVVGLGAGVVDTLAARRAELEEQSLITGMPPWFDVREMNGGAAPPKDVGGSVQGYGNARAYWFDQLKHSMRAGRVRVMDHRTLKEELEGVRYDYRSGKLYLESKEDIRKRGGKSPDYADALAYATAPVHEGLQAGDAVTEEPENLIRQMRLEEMFMLSDMSISPF